MMRDEEHIVYFISDLHLSLARPELCKAFLNLLPTIEKDATDFFILGDFFNFWVGDDISSPLTHDIEIALADLADKGISVYFQHGNRDFAVGKQFAKRCKMTLLPNVYNIPFAPEIILLHGDQLCIYDTQYQRYRSIIRHPIVLTLLKILPKSIRKKIGLKLRETSKKRQQLDCSTCSFNCKQQNMNCNKYDIPNEVADTLLSKYSATIMIHGHTHMPCVHQHENGTRWVLSDWDEVGDYIKWTRSDGLSRHTFEINS